MKKVSKIFAVLILAVMLMSFVSMVFAADDKTSYAPGSWKNQSATKIKTTDIKDFSASIINVISIVGSAAAIVTLIILGIKYMMGSAEEKAEYKKTLLPYIIGAAMVFGASVLTGVIYNFMQGS